MPEISRRLLSGHKPDINPSICIRNYANHTRTTKKPNVQLLIGETELNETNVLKCIVIELTVLFTVFHCCKWLLIMNKFSLFLKYYE